MGDPERLLCPGTPPGPSWVIWSPRIHSSKLRLCADSGHLLSAYRLSRNLRVWLIPHPHLSKWADASPLGGPPRSFFAELLVSRDLNCPGRARAVSHSCRVADFTDTYDEWPNGFLSLHCVLLFVGDTRSPGFFPGDTHKSKTLRAAAPRAVL